MDIRLAVQQYHIEHQIGNIRVHNIKTRDWPYYTVDIQCQTAKFLVLCISGPCVAILNDQGHSPSSLLLFLFSLEVYDFYTSIDV